MAHRDRDYDIFRHHLAIKYSAYGYALWDPDPGNLYPAVKVGDVGYIREGQFNRLFNVLLPAEDESHANFGVPENYEQLTLHLTNHINIGKLSPNNFCSAKVISMTESKHLSQGPDDIPRVTFSCPMKEGAVLCLPIEATRENTVVGTDFGKWIVKHIDPVTETHRTRSWTNVALPGGQEYAQASFGARVDRGDDIVTINWQFSHESNRGVVLNCGPDGENLPEDQCIFIRGFRVTRKLRILPPKLKGVAGANPDPEGYDEEPDLELIPIPPVPEYRDPLHILLEYIAEEAPPNCEMVLVHDDDLARLDLDGIYDNLMDSLQPDVLLSYIQSLKPTVHSAQIDLSDGRNDASLDTESAWVATLSNVFDKLHSLSTPASQSLHARTPSSQNERYWGHVDLGHDFLGRPASEPNIPGSGGALQGYMEDDSMSTQQLGSAKHRSMLSPSPGAGTGNGSSSTKTVLEPTRTVRSTRIFGRGTSSDSSTFNLGEAPVVVLRVQVVSCQDLVAKDSNGKSDPYVVVSLMGKQSKTPVCKRNLNPVYKAKEATFDFPIYMSLVNKLGTLEFAVWDKNLIGKDDFLGNYALPIDQWFDGTVFAFNVPDNQDFSVDLKSSPRGSMRIKVGFVPLNSPSQPDFERIYNALKSAVQVLAPSVTDKNHVGTVIC